MKYVGQYKTENELRKEIKELEEVAKKGELTVPSAQYLNRLRSELETITRAQDPNRRPWPCLYG